MGDTDVNETVDTPQSLPPVASRTWTIAPFIVLAAAWLVLTGTLTYLVWTTSPAVPSASPYYGIMVLGGAALTLLGFVTGLTVWLLARDRSGQDGTDVGRRVWFRAVGTTAAGVALWWVALMLLDLLRAGASAGNGI